jgi:hypothetical protein
MDSGTLSSLDFLKVASLPEASLFVGAAQISVRACLSTEMGGCAMTLQTGTINDALVSQGSCCVPS